MSTLKPLFCLALISVLLACSPQSTQSEAAHAHDEQESYIVTDYNQLTELFVEFPPLQTGETSRFLAHLTWLDSFGPVTQGQVDVELWRDGRAVARFRVAEPTRDGLFTPSVTPRDAGEYQVKVIWSDKTSGRRSEHDLGQYHVHSSSEHAAVNQDEIEGDISFLKEQQWQQAFATTPVQSRMLSASIPAMATVVAPSTEQASIRAPQSGYVLLGKDIRAGMQIERGQVLGAIAPRASNNTDVISLRLEQAELERRVTLAVDEVQRLQQLVQVGAIPEPRLKRAEAERASLQDQLAAVRARISQAKLPESAQGIEFRSPITGVLVASYVQNGQFVEANTQVFDIATTDSFWLELKIPERYGSQVRDVESAWLLDDKQVIDINDRVISREYVVDAATRTYQVTLGEDGSDWRPLLGSQWFASARVAGHQRATAIPFSAVIQQDGRTVVFVQTSGETFARREVELGARDGDWVAVLRGVAEGERVVSVGAYDIRLAAIGGDAIGHGHAH